MARRSPAEEVAAESVKPRYGGIVAAAIYAGVSPNTIRARVKDGRIKAHRFGGKILIAFEDLDRAIRGEAA